MEDAREKLEELADIRAEQATLEADQEAAVARIEKVGGSVERDDQERVIGVRFDGINNIILRTLEALHVNSGRFTDDGLSRLAKVTTLRTVHLGVGQFSDEGLAGLSGLSELREVTLPGTFGGASLEHLRELSQLKIVRLTFELSEEFLKDYRPQQSIQQMTLRAAYTAEQLTAFRSLKSLRRLQRRAGAGAEDRVAGLFRMVLKARPGLRLLTSAAVIRVERFAAVRAADTCFGQQDWRSWRATLPPLSSVRSTAALLNTLTVIFRRHKASWLSLLTTDLLFKALAFVVLTPLLSLCQRLTIQVAGDGLMSDADFALLFTHPVGIACGVLVGAVWLGVISLEQACLLTILRVDDQGESAARLRPTAALQLSLTRAPALLRATGLVVCVTLAVLLPVAGIGFLVYRLLLGEYDINFYLSARPTECLVAFGIGGVLVAVSAAVLLWLFAGWILALPMIVFEERSATAALRASRQQLAGRRWQVVRWFGVWAIIVFVANLVVASCGYLAGAFLIPSSIDSALMLATRVGLLLMVLAAFSLLIHVFATVSFAAFVDTGYRRIAPGSLAPASQLHQVGRRTSLTLTRGRLLILLGGGVVLASWIGLQSLQSLPLDDDDVLVMAHRGASAAAPENTMAAFELAIEKEADWIELDVQESADGEVVVMHDSDFMKQSGNPLKVWDARVEQLADIDIGSWFDPQFADQRVARLSEVLDVCRDRIGVNIELKYYGHKDRLEQRVVDIVEAAGMSDQVKIMSLNKDCVRIAKGLRPDWTCGLLLSVSAGDLSQLDVDFVAINHSFASRAFIRRAHKAGQKVYVWTVNDTAAMSHMLNRGVDGLLTDRPALARRVLAERAQMSLTDRLLSELSVWLLNRDVESDDDVSVSSGDARK
ncbi:MAG: glycerophosphodiester phosphodiesterase [Planctomycetaceae bacterium]|nr:glycerophosphodiester phosphodiesterase [Planctomycetaceae bacterium]